MTDFSKASPRPFLHHGMHGVLDKQGCPVAEVYDPVDCELFINAVNAHDDLVAVLEEHRTDLVILSGNVFDAQRTDQRWEGMHSKIREWIDRIDVAIAKARGGK